ncbi:GNAT family N-acetyltransferase [Mumia zhuanghuii]|uniref:GNAT family N-acetyltransferase n=2 Tax=Mumia TaxID=1546255 RepID=A0ABW1QKC5_9ACTN|nr:MULTISPECIES: GNAT family N-acetyltransferase [Mumia]KAA1418316.1 GNAT family N-acetyltransferase [Mumia zhuanghuii]
MTILIDRADFTDRRLAAFLQAHLDDLAPTAPAESRHALDLSSLAVPEVRMWVAEGGGEIIGTAALAALEPDHEELKSMRTDPQHRGRGVAKGLLEHVLADARSRGVARVSLETGTMDFFAAARALYARAGFVACDPFGSYQHDPNSTFMTRTL